MNATLLVLALFAQTPSSEAQPASAGDPPPAAAPATTDPNAPAGTTDPNAPPATTTPPADPSAQPTPPAADAPAPSADTTAPRATDIPLSETTTEQKIGRIVSAVVLGTGAFLLVVGVTGLAATAFLQFNPTRDALPDQPFNEDVIRTLSTISSAVAAGGLMLGLTCVLGGIFGVFVG